MYVLSCLSVVTMGYSHDPLDVCFDDQLKHTSSESRGIPLSPQIRTARHTSSVLKSLKTQSDKITPKGKLNSLQESRGGEKTS